MPWFRIDDRFHSHPKVMQAGTAAAGLFVRCGSYAAEHLTDGFIPESVALQYGSKEWVQRLVDACLWVIVDGGYRMPDFLDYNPSRAKVLDERRKAAERQKKARDKRQEESRRDSRVSHFDSHAASSPSPSRPEGTGTNTGSQSSYGRNARTWADDDDSIDLGIVELLKELTGRDVPIVDAAKIRRQILDGRTVKNRAAYVASAIHDNPGKFLPAGPAEPAADSPSLKVVPDWCGHCSSDFYRWLELADGRWAKCPACNPDAAKEAS